MELVLAVLDVAWPIVTVLAGLAVSYLAKKSADWIGIDSIAKHRSELSDMAEKAVMSARGIVQTETGEDPDKKALVYKATKMLDKYAPEVTMEQAQEWVESATDLLGLNDAEKEKNKGSE